MRVCPTKEPCRKDAYVAEWPPKPLTNPMFFIHGHIGLHKDYYPNYGASNEQENGKFIGDYSRINGSLQAYPLPRDLYIV